MGACCSSVEGFEYETASYEDLEAKILPLDLVFFRGKNAASRLVIEASRFRLGNGDWSHVGIIINRKALPTLKNATSDDELFVWESTISGQEGFGDSSHILDAETGKGVLGVQIRPLRELMRTSTTKTPIAWAKLINNPFARREREQDKYYEARIKKTKDVLETIHRDYFLRPYQMNCCKLLTALCCCCCNCFCKGCSRDKVICSQFVIVVYQRVGLIEAKVDASEMVPVDLAQNADLKLTPGKELVEDPVIMFSKKIKSSYDKVQEKKKRRAQAALEKEKKRLAKKGEEVKEEVDKARQVLASAAVSLELAGVAGINALEEAAADAGNEANKLTDIQLSVSVKA